MTTVEQPIPLTKPCPHCKGTGISQYVWNNQTHEFGPGPCRYCNSTGQHSKPDFQAIMTLITKPGKNGRTFRKSKPDFENEFKNKLEGQAYFVWRMIRFHSGCDVTMPVVASSCVNNDPYYDELETLASLLAKRWFGTDMAAAYRWGNALGHSLPVPDNMPATAFSCGPVADEHKPECELPEIA